MTGRELNRNDFISYDGSDGTLQEKRIKSNIVSIGTQAVGSRIEDRSQPATLK